MFRKITFGAHFWGVWVDFSMSGVGGRQKCFSTQHNSANTSFTFKKDIHCVFYAQKLRNNNISHRKTLFNIKLCKVSTVVRHADASDRQLKVHTRLATEHLTLWCLSVNEVLLAFRHVIAILGGTHNAIYFVMEPWERGEAIQHTSITMCFRNTALVLVQPLWGTWYLWWSIYYTRRSSAVLFILAFVSQYLLEPFVQASELSAF